MIPFLKKKIFLTRSDEDNLKFQRYFNLVQKKVDARELFVSTPLLNISFIKFEKLIIPEMNIIFTSRYGVKALTGIENLKLKQVYCVGKSTAETAIKYGYQNVQFSEEGNVSSLIKLISKEVKNPQRLHYIRGKKVSFNLKKELSDLGFKIKETIVYDQVFNKLSSEQKKLIMDGKVLGSTFFSASVAKYFCDNLKKVPDGFLFFCISDRVANIINRSNTEGKYTVKVSKKPTQESMIDLICKEDILC